MLNVLVYMATGTWNIDTKSIGIMALMFALVLFRSFDEFITNLKGFRDSQSS